MTNYSEQFTQYFSNLLSSDKKAIDLNRLKARIDDFKNGNNGKSSNADDIGQITANSSKEMIDEFVKKQGNDFVLNNADEIKKFAEFWRSWNENSGNGDFGFVDPRRMWGQPTVTEKAIANPENTNEEISSSDTRQLAEAGVRNVFFNADNEIDTGEIDFITKSTSASPTASPSATPTTSPSVSPSASPSTSPTASPSVSPSATTSPSASVSPTTTPSPKPKVQDLGEATVEIRADIDGIDAISGKRGKDEYKDFRVTLPEVIRKYILDANTPYQFVLTDKDDKVIRESLKDTLIISDTTLKAFFDLEGDFDPSKYKISVRQISDNSEVATIKLTGNEITRGSRKIT